MTNALITKREAADLLGCDPSTVNRLVSDGHLKPSQTIKNGNRVVLYMFSRRAVERLATKRAAA